MTFIAAVHVGLMTTSPCAVSSMDCSESCASRSKEALRLLVAVNCIFSAESEGGVEVLSTLVVSLSMTEGGASTTAPVMPWAARFCCAARWRSDHWPVGVSGQRRSRPRPTAVMQIPGTTKDTRQATWADRCWWVTRESKMAGMRKYVMPPPELPKPAVKALAAPTTFLSKKPVDQTWQGTKEPPRMPIKKRRAMSSGALYAVPDRNVGIAPTKRQPANVLRGPK